MNVLGTPRFWYTLCMFQKDNLHHAYFVEGKHDAVLAYIEAFLLDAFGITRQGHPDVHYAEYESFGIDEGRALQEMQGMKSVVGDRKIFILSVNSITNEAQNALLKVFEEPTPGTHFFVISSSHRILLPTLRSRMVVVTHDSSNVNSVTEDAKTFLSLSPKARLDFVAPLIEEKDRVKSEHFLQALIAQIAQSRDVAKNAPALKELLTLVTYSKDRASSLKLILERTALLRFE